MVTVVKDTRTVLHMVQEYGLRFDRPIPLLPGRNVDIFDHSRRVPHRVLRRLVKVGLVQGRPLMLDGGSWVYRLTELGDVLTAGLDDRDEKVSRP